MLIDESDPTCETCQTIRASLHRLETQLPEHPNVLRVEHLALVHSPAGEHGALCAITLSYTRLEVMPQDQAMRSLFMPSDLQRVLERVSQETGLPYHSYEFLTGTVPLDAGFNVAWSSRPSCESGTAV